MKTKIYYIFLAPSVLILFVVFIFPSIYTLSISFFDFRSGTSMGKVSFIGLGNYAKTILSPRFLHSIWITFYNLALVLTGSMLIGFITAHIFHQDFPARSIARSLAVIPMMATPAAIALLMVVMYHPTVGVINYILTLVGIPPQLWSYGPKSVIPSISLVQIWQFTPLAMLFILGGLASLPEEPYEAATVDGATWLQKLWYITLPLLRPHIFVCAMILTIDTVQQFDLIYIMTRGGPGISSETMNILLYDTAFSYYYFSEASAIGMLFLIIIFVPVFILLLFRQGKK